MGDEFLNGYLVKYDYYWHPHRFRCKKCGSLIMSDYRMQRTWNNRKIRSKQAYCPTCKKFKHTSSIEPVNEIYKPFG
jgi:hypothetical protein